MLLKKLLNFGGKKPRMEFEDKNVKEAAKKAARTLQNIRKRA